MKKTMWKTTMREIRQSLGRFLAILAIVALGVGMFSGLKTTKPFMVKTVEDYLKEKNFYDFRLISTLGFEQEDVAYFVDKPQVRAAEGSYTFDILYRYENQEGTGVMKAHSLMESVNGLQVVYGRLPENAGECVVDSRCLGEDALGQSIYLSEENKSKDLDNFAQKEFTVVGIVNASYYIQFERGNTALGNGQIDGFMYLLPEAFDSEAYTEIFVKLDEDTPLYSEEYDAYISEKEGEWEEYLEQAATRRYEDILQEAYGELADATQEFEEEKKKAETELADAKEELAEAEEEIADGWQEIEDAKAEFAEGYAEIAKNEKELADGEITLRENEATLLTKEQELNDGFAEWDAGNQTVEANKRTLDEAETQLNEQELGLQQQEAMLLEQRNQLETQKAELLAAFGSIPEEYAAAIAAGEAQLAEGERQIAEGRGQIAAYRLQLTEGRRQLEAADLELRAAWEQLQDGKRQLEEGKQEISDAWKELADGKRKLAEAKQELADAKEELAEAEEELADGETEYQEGLQEYEDGLKEFQEEIAEAETELTDARQEIEELEAPDTFLLGRDTNVGYVCLENDSKIVEDVAVVFPVFFFLVAALVCMTTMNRMIEEQRTQIGVLKALGYSNGAIMAKYLFYSGAAAFLGSVIGFLMGTGLLNKAIWNAYGIMYDVGALCFYIHWPIAIVSMLAALLCSMGVTWYSCRMELREVSAALMRPKAPRAGKRIFLERLPFIWSHLKFLQKVSIRNVLRYKKRFLMMVIGIGGCTALLVTGFGIKDSIADVVSMQYGEILVYDMSVMFKETPDEEARKEYEEVLNGWTDSKEQIPEYILISESAVDMQVKDRQKSISLIVPEVAENLTSYIDLHTLSGEKLSYPGVNEAVISHKLAEDFGLKIGDTICLTDEHYNQMQVTVSGIHQNFVDNYVFLHPDTYRQQWREPEFKSAYINLPRTEETDTHQLAADLMKLEVISNVTVNKDVEERFANMLSSMDFIVLVIIFCAATLAFIVLYNLTNINITERIREIATIKVLGFYKKETATYVFRENLMLTAIGGAVGLLLGKTFHAFVMSCIKIDMVAFDVRINGNSYVYSLLLTFAFAWFVNCFMSGKLEKISMTESLKSVD